MASTLGDVLNTMCAVAQRAENLEAQACALRNVIVDEAFATFTRALMNPRRGPGVISAINRVFALGVVLGENGVPSAPLIADEDLAFVAALRALVRSLTDPRDESVAACDDGGEPCRDLVRE